MRMCVVYVCVCVCTCVYVRIVERKTERGQRGRGVFVSFVEVLESKPVRWDDCRVCTYLSIEGKQTGTGAGLACWSLLSLRLAAFREQANSKGQWCSKPGPEGGAVRRETQGKLPYLHGGSRGLLTSRWLLETAVCYRES